MKQLVSFVSILFMSILCLYSQDWQPVRSGRIALFDDDQGRIKSIRIDSVKFDRDSVLFPMFNIQQLDYNCFTPRGNSWMGKRVIIQSNGVNLFFNNENDTIRINTRAKVGESWTLFEIKDSIKIIAEVKSAEIQDILGESDSVKTIGFKVYEKNVLEEHHHLSDESLIISKNYGFVRMMNFKVFPKEPNALTSEILESFNLIGLTNPNRGVQNLTWLGVHDFQVGDELHVVNNSWNWSIVPGFRNALKSSFKFLERKESKDSVFYRIERKESLEKAIERWDNKTYSFIHDTITQVYKPNIRFDKLPGEPIVIDNGADAYGMFIEGAFIKKDMYGPTIRHSFNDSCWHLLNWHGGDPGYYLKGLGGPYYGWNEVISGGERALVYYKKGSATWGTPLVITGVESLSNEDQLKVYPNPAADFVTIENTSGRTESYILRVIDLQGREVWSNPISISNSYRLDLTAFKGGVYLLKLQNGDSQISRMFVKKR